MGYRQIQEGQDPSVPKDALLDVCEIDCKRAHVRIVEPPNTRIVGKMKEKYNYNRIRNK